MSISRRLFLRRSTALVAVSAVTVSGAIGMPVIPSGSAVVVMERDYTDLWAKAEASIKSTLEELISTGNSVVYEFRDEDDYDDLTPYGKGLNDLFDRDDGEERPVAHSTRGPFRRVSRTDVVIIDDLVDVSDGDESRMEAFLEDNPSLSKKFTAMGGRTFGPLKMKSLS